MKDHPHIHSDCPPSPRSCLRVAIPAGIGDAIWALAKIPALLRRSGAETLDIGICEGRPRRTRPFVERFDFVQSVRYCERSCVGSPRATPDGFLNWVESRPNWHGYDWLLQANSHLERGRRLEAWLPDLETDWRIAERFRFTDEETRHALRLERRISPYCVFYLGPERGNTVAGHNRGPLWKPEDWGQLAAGYRRLGLAIVVVGAEYDRSYYVRYAGAHLGPCHDAIGRWEIGHTLAVIRRARFVVAYQSGIGIVPVYMGVPAAVFWRPHGDSINAKVHISFDERMAEAWAPREALSLGRYLPLIYTRSSPESIVEHAVGHGWLLAR